MREAILAVCVVSAAKCLIGQAAGGTKMKRYEVYIYNGTHGLLRYDTDNIDEACDKAYELE